MSGISVFFVLDLVDRVDLGVAFGAFALEAVRFLPTMTTACTGYVDND